MLIQPPSSINGSIPTCIALGCFLEHKMMLNGHLTSTFLHTNASIVHAYGTGQLQANPPMAGAKLPMGSPPEWR